MRQMRRVVASAGAAVVALLMTSQAAAYTIIETADQSGNGRADTWTLDDNGDGSVDRMVIDGNEDGWVEIELRLDLDGRTASLWVDSNLDARYDAVLVPYYADSGTGTLAGTMGWLDLDLNGAWELAYYDGDLDGYYEWVMVDTNYDGSADSWRGNVAPPGQTATDELARQIASIEAVNILHTAGIPVFFPSSTIPLGG